MKNIKFLYSLLLAAVCLSSCKEKELELYNSSSTIYFEGKFVGKRYQPFSDYFYSFGYTNTEIKVDTFNIHVMATGEVKNRDRKYLIEFDPASTLKEGRDYEFVNKEFAIKANKVSDTVQIRLLRNNVMTMEALNLKMRLKANANFVTDFQPEDIETTTASQPTTFNDFTLYVDDIAGAPFFWDKKINPSGAQIMITYLGEYSSKKFQLLIDRYDLDIPTVTSPGFRPSVSMVFSWAFGTQGYLNEMKAKGTTVYEADGVTEMRMGQAVK
ncbi:MULTISPECIES: DUF4843 domain-containing protein [Sphingobacterium]|uniref:DUF4843 domain-containing protein n=1 Tax=Sphingobacterium TaxID=28453 RepID=UPI0013DC87DA|nr:MULTISPECIES: DUF4843 domain-containing protein [unclassified Sphingobacterium]